MHLRLAVLLCLSEARRSRRDERLAQYPADVSPVTRPAEDKREMSTAVINSLNLTLVPPEALLNDTSPKQEVLDDDADDGAAEFLKSLTRGWEKRRELKLARAGIRYDATTAQYKTPLGLPCDPRDHPLICQKEEEETTTTTRLPVGVKLRRRRRDLMEDSREGSGEQSKAAEWNPFIDGPQTDTPKKLDDIDTDDFIEEEVLTSGRRRRRAEW